MDKDQFAQLMGYEFYEDLLMDSDAVVEDHDTTWYITQAKEGIYAWDDYDLDSVRVQRFESVEDAVRFQWEGFQAVAFDLPGSAWVYGWPDEGQGQEEG